MGGVARYTDRMNETESARFHHLRGQVLRGATLSSAETHELSEYMARLGVEERDLLQPAREAQEARIAEAERRIVELRDLTARREALAAYLRRVNDEVTAERDAINGAFQRLFGTAASVS